MLAIVIGLAGWIGPIETSPASASSYGSVSIWVRPCGPRERISLHLTARPTDPVDTAPQLAIVSQAVVYERTALVA
jgi:hypothetical protein